MFNVKVTGITAGIAFILSFLIGIISGGALLIVLLRAGMWGIVFFILVAGGYGLINRFIPDLLHLGQAGEAEEESEDVPGSHVDISVEDPDPESPAPPPRGIKEAKLMESPSSDTVSALDQNHKNGYAKEGRGEENNSGFVPTSLEITSPRIVSSEEVKSKEKLVSPPKQGANGEDSQGIRTKETPEDHSKVQTKLKQVDPKKMDPLQMASTIQTMLRQE